MNGGDCMASKPRVRVHGSVKVKTTVKAGSKRRARTKTIRFERSKRPLLQQGSFFAPMSAPIRLFSRCPHAAAVEGARPQQNPARSSAAAPTRAAWCLRSLPDRLGLGGLVCWLSERR